MKKLTAKYKESLVRDLVDSFDDRNSIHIAYKRKVKNMILEALYVIGKRLEDQEGDISKEEIASFVHDFVEERFGVES